MTEISRIYNLVSVFDLIRCNHDNQGLNEFAFWCSDRQIALIATQPVMCDFHPFIRIAVRILSVVNDIT